MELQVVVSGYPIPLDILWVDGWSMDLWVLGCHIIALVRSVCPIAPPQA